MIILNKIIKRIHTTLYIVSLCYFQQEVYSLQNLQTQHAIEQAIENVQSQKLWEDTAWRRLLFISDRYYSSNKSLIDEDRFFLAEDGKNNPESEMKATIKAFFQEKPENVDEKYVHPQCQFPARYYWLNTKLNLEQYTFAKQPCTEKDRFIKFLSYKKVSLVFSNYSADSAGSAFGHTFLRLQREKENANDPVLFDDILNFAAMINESDSILYPFKGLFGFYQGRFSLLAYYNKIQEYSNYESRDLWEYNLNLTPSEIKLLELILWEIAPTFTNYYYLHENCAFLMLSVLEAVKPELYLTKQFSLYVLPADSIRAVTGVPNLVKDTTYRPSILSRYLLRYETLNENEIDILKNIIYTKSLSQTKFFEQNPSSQARIIDTAIEFIDYTDRIAGSRISENYKDLRSSMLINRSKNDTALEPLSQKPMSRPPDKGHSGSVIGLYAGMNEHKQASFLFQWRPALHDLSAKTEGYSDSQNIGFFDTTIGVEKNNKQFKEQIFLKKFHMFEVTALPTQVPMKFSTAWRLDLGFERGYGVDTAKDKYRAYGLMGAGQSRFYFNKNFLIYGLLHADAGFAKEIGFHLGPTIRLGSMINLGESAKIVWQSDIGERYGLKGKVRTLNHSVTLSVFPSQQYEMRLLGMNEQGTLTAYLETMFYF